MSSITRTLFIFTGLAGAAMICFWLGRRVSSKPPADPRIPLPPRRLPSPPLRERGIVGTGREVARIAAPAHRALGAPRLELPAPAAHLPPLPLLDPAAIRRLDALRTASFNSAVWLRDTWSQASGVIRPQIFPAALFPSRFQGTGAHSHFYILPHEVPAFLRSYPDFRAQLLDTSQMLLTAWESGVRIHPSQTTLAAMANSLREFWPTEPSPLRNAFADQLQRLLSFTREAVLRGWGPRPAAWVLSAVFGSPAEADRMVSLRPIPPLLAPRAPRRAAPAPGEPAQGLLSARQIDQIRALITSYADRPTPAGSPPLPSRDRTFVANEPYADHEVLLAADILRYAPKTEAAMLEALQLAFPPTRAQHILNGIVSGDALIPVPA